MTYKHKLRITARDRLMYAWETSMGLVRDYRAYAQELDDDPQAADLFEELAEEECVHASHLLRMLHTREE